MEHGPNAVGFRPVPPAGLLEVDVPPFGTDHGLHLALPVRHDFCVCLLILRLLLHLLPGWCATFLFVARPNSSGIFDGLFDF